MMLTHSASLTLTIINGKMGENMYLTRLIVRMKQNHICENALVNNKMPYTCGEQPLCPKGPSLEVGILACLPPLPLSPVVMNPVQLPSSSRSRTRQATGEPAQCQMPPGHRVGCLGLFQPPGPQHRCYRGSEMQPGE